MSREVHVRFWESARVRFLRATQLAERGDYDFFLMYAPINKIVGVS